VKFGIIAPYALGPVEDGAFAVGFARLAEEMGFESLWVVEHVVMSVEYASVYPYDPSGRSPFTADVVQPDPLVWLAYVAAATSRIRLATGVLILPQRNPVILAKACASLDRLSGGRLELGIGVGWVREEAAALGVSFEDRGARADEWIAVMRTLWRDPVASFRGRYFDFHGVVSKPQPLQEGGVPITIGGHSKAAARRAGTNGDGFYPLGVSDEKLRSLLEIMKAAAASAGRDASGIELTLLAAPDLAGAEHNATLGAARTVIAARTGDLAELRRTLERYRRDVIERL
jgi:probable F420-dependent oxidoreductase